MCRPPTKDFFLAWQDFESCGYCGRTTLTLNGRGERMRASGPVERTVMQDTGIQHSAVHGCKGMVIPTVDIAFLARAVVEPF